MPGLLYTFCMIKIHKNTLSSEIEFEAAHIILFIGELLLDEVLHDNSVQSNVSTREHLFIN